MNTAFYTGVSGMIAFQEHMNVTAHNISNSKTHGFKGGRSSFADLMYTQMDVRTEGEKLAGHGTKHASTDLIMKQGTLNQTGFPLDFAIVGDGFFALTDPEGNQKYTRNGAFNISVEGKKAYLTAKEDGSYVLDAKGKPIELVKNEDAETYDLTGLSEKLGVYSFRNPYGLTRDTASCFLATPTSGEGLPVENNKDNPTYEIKEATLEFSSVDIATEMLNVIQAQRAFQMNSKVVQTADQIEEMINNLR